jgi:tetratricopeptide (TPR) repeat protein
VPARRFRRSELERGSDRDLTLGRRFRAYNPHKCALPTRTGGCMMRDLLRLGWLIPLVLAANLLQAQRQEPQQGPTNLQVYVVYDDSRPAGAHLQVNLVSSSGIPVAEGFTDSSGRTLLQAPGSGGYTVKVSGEAIQKGATESVDVVPCPMVQCTRTVFVRTKAVAGAADGSGGTSNAGKKNKGTESVGKAPNAAITSAAELRIPASARKAFDEGMTAWQKHDYKQAAEKFEKSVADYPQYDTAYNNLGVMYAHLGENDKSMSAFKRAVELNDKNADADRNLARLLIRQKHYPQAEELLKKALTVQAPDATTLTMLAISEVQDGKPDEALKDAQKVHALPHEGYAVVHYIAGEVLEEKHQTTEAVAEYNLYLKEAPSGNEAPLVKNALQRLSSPSASAAPTPQSP